MRVWCLPTVKNTISTTRSQTETDDIRVLVQEVRSGDMRRQRDTVVCSWLNDGRRNRGRMSTRRVILLSVARLRSWPTPSETFPEGPAHDVGVGLVPVLRTPTLPFGVSVRPWSSSRPTPGSLPSFSEGGKLFYHELTERVYVSFLKRGSSYFKGSLVLLKETEGSSSRRREFPRYGPLVQIRTFTGTRKKSPGHQWRQGPDREVWGGKWYITEMSCTTDTDLSVYR